MNRTIRRAITVVGATVGVFALSTGTAMAHYCYRTDVPEKSNMRNGGAWMTQEEALEGFAGFLPPGDCATRVLAHIEALPENTLFMGPGLLAAGAVQNGQAPDGFGHVFEDAMAFPECAFLFQ
ncbi:MAG: hypothetical protein ACRDO1_16295 [Nocardioidaceae bacterium]